MLNKFEQLFRSKPAVRAIAPGRVNLIGEHTDYNDGFVLPIAIQYAISVLAAPRADGQVQIYSLDYDSQIQFSLAKKIEKVEDHSWSNYERGVFEAFQRRGFKPAGMDMLISGDVPLGAGLSSSAAVEMATAMAIRELFQFDVSTLELVRLAQEAENQFVGMNCGIMDQFISGMGKAGHALFLDCRSLDYEQVPFPADEYSVVIMNTRVKRELTGSEYNERRSQCEEGVRLLAENISGVTALRDVSVSDFELYAMGLPVKVRDRCRHVVYENQRVESFVQALMDKDSDLMGELLLASHEDLRELYSVSCPELDLMVEIAMGVEGVVGARMTGAGFGGCAIALVEKGGEEVLKAAVLEQYTAKTGITPEIYVSTPSDGARAERL